MQEERQGHSYRPADLTSLPPKSWFPAPLIGRQPLLEHLFTWLQEQHSFALVGLPGIGKTTLALTLTQMPQVRELFPDGIFWGGLGPMPSLHTLLSGWAHRLGLTDADITRATSLDQLAGMLHAVIGQRAMLFIIDDAWKLEDALHLVIGGTQCATLLTTRFPPIAAQFAQHYVVAVPELAIDQGMLLLDALAHTAVQQFPEDTRHLVEQVGGLPLALLLMGRYLYRESLSGQPRRIRKALAALATLETRMHLAEPLPTVATSSHAAATTLSLHHTIALSITTLPPVLQQQLASIASLPAKPQSFPEEVVYAMWNTDAITGGSLLDTLMDAGLVESAMPGRYTIHQAIADFARGLPGVPASTTRFLHFMAAFVATCQATPMELRNNLPLILHALHVADQEGNRSLLISMILDLFPYWEQAGMYTLLTEEGERAIVAAIAVSDTTALQIGRSWLGRAWRILGALAKAEMYVQAGLQAAQDPIQRAQFLLLQGQIRQEQGEFAAALILLREAESVARRAQAAELLCDILPVLSIELLRDGYTPVAQELLEEGIALARRLERHEALARNLSRLGVLAGMQGAYEVAIQWFEESLAIAQHIPSQRLIGNALLNLGMAARRQGHVEVAEQRLHAALQVERAIGYRAAIGDILSELTQLMLEGERLQEAHRYLEEGLGVAREMNALNRLGDLLLRAARLARREGQLAEAEAAYQEGLALAQRSGYEWYTISFQIEQGEVALACGQIEEASRIFNMALGEARRLAYPELIPFAAYGAARGAERGGDRSTAGRLARESLQFFQASHHHMAQEVEAWVATLR